MVRFISHFRGMLPDIGLYKNNKILCASIHTIKTEPLNLIGLMVNETIYKNIFVQQKSSSCYRTESTESVSPKMVARPVSTGNGGRTTDPFIYIRS